MLFHYLQTKKKPLAWMSKGIQFWKLFRLVHIGTIRECFRLLFGFLCEANCCPGYPESMKNCDDL